MCRWVCGCGGGGVVGWVAEVGVTNNLEIRNIIKLINKLGMSYAELGYQDEVKKVVFCFLDI